MNLSQIIKLKNKNLILQNVDGTNLGLIQARDILLSLRFNGLSSIAFTIDEENCEIFDMITSYKLVELQDVGKFIIENPVISNDGLSRSKTVTCRSYEIDINRKTIPYLNGVYKFYSPISTDETIISIILSYLPSWSIESIDISLWNTYRYFDISDVPLYQFITENVSNSLECVFMFNSLNKTIKVVAYENILKTSDIYLSFKNLINQIDITEDTESLCTALTVRGAGDLGINLVNTLGNNTIYNFDHFLNSVDKKTGTPFMSNSLKDAINGWQTTIDTYQTTYADYLTTRATKLSELITLQSQLTELEGQLKALTVTRDALLEANLNATTKNTEVRNKQSEIDAKELEITNKETEIEGIDFNLKAINNAVAFDKYFTTEQILEIEPYVIQKSVTDENFIAGSQDSLLDIQNTAQALYDKYKKWLVTNSKLQYDFSIDLINFINQNSYNLFTRQLDWGITVTLDNGDGTVSYPMLQGLDIPLDDNDSNVQFIFGTKMRFSSATDTYEQFLANQVSNAVNSVASSGVKWGEYVNSGNRDKIESLFKKGLQADLTEVSNSSNQEVVMDFSGLMGRKLLETGGYDNRQWKMINNKLLFTDDGWNTAKLALGLIHCPDNSYMYGINTEILLGILTITSQLIVENSSNTFRVDSNGATLTDATFTINDTNGLNRILLDPNNGFKIQKLIGGIWTDMIYLDIDGNAVFVGDIKGGTINISNNFKVDSDGNVTMDGNLDIGNGKLIFDSITGDLTLEGDITANDLFLYINGVKTSIIDELTGKIDGQYITGGMSGTTALGNLLVDNLSTSDKIRNYLASNTAQVNYIRIYDQFIEFVEATYAGGTTQARTGDKTGDLLYWTDDTYNFVTSVTDGSLEPVIVYNYTELIKGKYGYEMVGGVNQPTITLGAGSGNTADSGKTFIYKGVDGFYIDYKHSVTGASTIFKITDNGIDLSQFTNVTYNENTTISGMIQIWVQPDEPLQAKEKDLWVDTDDFTRYDKSDISVNTTLLESDNELIKASGTITITLHSATTAGIVKYIRNVGNGIITLVGTINGQINMTLYPNEGVSLKTEGNGWGIY